MSLIGADLDLLVSTVAGFEDLGGDVDELADFLGGQSREQAGLQPLEVRFLRFAELLSAGSVMDTTTSRPSSSAVEG
ncbi:MAG: hypothetical protein M3O70_21415 [Actinomycetota bacterium]|nr:hypothetical protein [Actinomycetota bacterium]